MPASRSTLTFVLIAIYVVVGLGCALLITIGVQRVEFVEGIVCLAVGLVGVVFMGATLPISLLLMQLLKRTRTSDGVGGGNLRAIEGTLAQLHQNSMLSDAAKRVLFREQELDLLRRAIEEDIRHGDYNAGLTLCDEMANLFGHREEAEEYRNRILQAGHAAYESKVRQALEHLDQVLSRRDWGAAYREAASIRRLYPDHHLVQQLDQRILLAREQHKTELESMLMDAANRDDVPRAMQLLRELDKYLTREEAERLAKVAQNIVSKHREGLSVNFKRAVNEHRWKEAAQVGDTIIREYPNTKMADEVRGLIEVLRVRASQGTPTNA